MKAGSNGSAFISFHPLMVDIKTHLSSRPYMCWQLTEKGGLPPFERQGALGATDGVSLTNLKAASSRKSGGWRQREDVGRE